MRALVNGGHTYARLQEIFRRADLRYNSGLFHFEVEKDRAEASVTLTPNLVIDAKVLVDIFGNLYTPQCIEERKRILMHNLCSVDIAPQAVEVTKLSRHRLGHHALRSTYTGSVSQVSP